MATREQVFRKTLVVREGDAPMVLDSSERFLEVWKELYRGARSARERKRLDELLGHASVGFAAAVRAWRDPSDWRWVRRGRRLEPDLGLKPHAGRR